MHMFIDKVWYRRHFLRWFLFPFALLYCFIVKVRRQILQIFCQQTFSVPVIVVGNITVGGVGKTPFVCALAHEFVSRGLRVGIVSRGYGAHVTQFPYLVTANDHASDVGDEPLLLARKTACPVVIDPKRNQAVQYLLDNFQSQIIISDDGLQHYKMGRAIEIVVIDGARGFGNGLCLPAGPLRERIKRIQQVDFVIVNGEPQEAFSNLKQLNKSIYRMELQPDQFIQLTTGRLVSCKELGASIAAVAGIGNPQRFFSLLNRMGIKFTAYPFADHHCFRPEEFTFREKVVVMTEKDAVKCFPFATDAMYFLPVEAKIGKEFWRTLWSHQQLQDYV